MSYLLLQILEDIPPHVHVGILLAATVPSASSGTANIAAGDDTNSNDNDDAADETTTTFSYLDLTSPVPHTLHFVQYADDEDDDDEDDDNDDEDDNIYGDNVKVTTGGLLDKMSLVPADELHLSNIQAAIRSLVDYDPSQLVTSMSQQHDYTMSMPLGKTIETVLDYMDRGQHPGQVELTMSGSNNSDDNNASQEDDDDDDHDGDDDDDHEQKQNPLENQILYAGGKIMTFLASCPTDLRGDDWRPLTRKSLPKTTVGLGGFGGSVDRTANHSTAAGADANADADANSSPPNNNKKSSRTGKKKFAKSSRDEEAGFGGSSSDDDESDTDDSDSGSDNSEGDDDDELDTDMTPASLLDYYRAPEHVEAYFQELGSQCAESALGVDVFVLVQPREEDNQQEESYGGVVVGADYDDVELDVGLPFLRELADRSGAPGPLVFPLHQGYSTPIRDNPNIQRLRREVHARVPWGGYIGNMKEGNAVATVGSPGIHQPMAFGGEMRLRLSTSFEVDKSPVDEVDEGPQLAPLYSSGGIMGPAAEEEETGNLWRLGTCDPFTSLTVDLDMKDKEAKDVLDVEGMGEISWKPVIQTCFAYTAIVQDPERPGQYITVRQMRIACSRVPLTDNVETLYASIDPEVIGTVLFHKLTLTLLRDGLSTAQTIGEDWLRSLLVCAYQSAETQEEIQREEAEHGLTSVDANGDSDKSALKFYANERLLDREGELSAEDVLLAQGHELLKTLPLVVYSLLHCDAIRPSSSSSGNKIASYSYLPTLDARCAAGAQMSSMNPPVLSKCIAPHLQLWSCSQGLILDNLDLRMEAIRLAVEEFGNDASTGKQRDDLVLLMDSPDCILVCDASQVSNKPATHKADMKIGPALQEAVNAAIRGYRTPPKVIYDIGSNSTNGATKQPGFLRLLASLVEDLPGSNGASNFKAWGENLAGEIHDELEKEED